MHTLYLNDIHFERIKNKLQHVTIQKKNQYTNKFKLNQKIRFINYDYPESKSPLFVRIDKLNENGNENVVIKIKH